jgi:hypothetical protein
VGPGDFNLDPNRQRARSRVVGEEARHARQ